MHESEAKTKKTTTQRTGKYKGKARTVERERNSAGWRTWDEARAAAANRENWRHSVEALCATRHKEAK